MTAIAPPQLIFSLQSQHVGDTTLPDDVSLDDIDADMPPGFDANMPPGWDRSMAPGWGMNGKLIHGLSGGGKGVPVQRWCVSRDDLIFLRETVKRAIADGTIRPTDLDQFDPNDDVVGPNMYTVCQQYIKPLTRAAGSMSWALMRNPEGLDCDLFITHGWIEGVFEFTDKVLASWPYGKQACYVCILSNPQNLDIGELIKTPAQSPFAICLCNASHMLVIPNRHASIYSRLWCVYEAWLAVTKEKTILTAKAPVGYQVLRCLCLLMVPMVLGVVTGYANPSVEFLEKEEKCDQNDIYLTTCLCAGLAILSKLFATCQCVHTNEIESPRSLWSKIIAPFPLLQWCNFTGTFYGAYATVAIFTRFHHCLGLHTPAHEREDGQTFGLDWRTWGLAGYTVTLTSYFLGSEVDRISEIQHAKEKAQLRRHFSSVAKAECTDSSDKEHILSEMAQQMGDVDACVSILQVAGMSTPNLRSAANLGTDVSRAAHFSVGNIILASGLWITSNIIFLTCRRDYTTSAFLAIFVIASLGCLAVFIAIYWTRVSKEQHCFMISTATKVKLMETLALLFMSQDTMYELPIFFAVMLFMSSMIILFCSILGMIGIARIWCCGPRIAGLMAPGTSARSFSHRAGQFAKQSTRH